MPQVLRWILALLLLVALAGAGYEIYGRFGRETEIKIAVESLEGDDALALTSMANRLAANGAHFRLALVATGGDEQSMELVRSGQAVIASIRSDAVNLKGLSSVMALLQEHAVVISPTGSAITEWKSLERKSVAVTGRTSINDPLLTYLLGVNGASNAHLIAMPPDKVTEALQSRTIQAVAFVGPMPGVTSRAIKQANIAKVMKTKPNFLDLEDAETLATANRRYLEGVVLAGTLNRSPQIPSENIASLTVTRHLVMARSTSKHTVIRFLGEMMETKRQLFASQPVLQAAGAPDLETDAFVMVHPGARMFFNNETRSITDWLIEYIYLVPMVLGALGSCIVWFVRFLWPQKNMTLEDIIGRLFAILKALDSHATPSDIEHKRTELAEIITRIETLRRTNKLELEETSALLSTVATIEMRLAQQRDRLSSVSFNAT